MASSHGDSPDSVISPAPSVGSANAVYTALADEIATGVLQPGERLPPERAMADKFGVGRGAVRRALGALAAEGLIESHVGRGTFVARGHLGEPPNVLMSFTELGRTHGLTPSSRVLEQRAREATLDEANAFRVAPGAPILQLDRLRLLDGNPIAVDSSRVPLSLAPGLVDLDLAAGSLYDALTDAGCGPVRADYTVEAVSAAEPLATLLEAPVGSAVLVANTRAYEETGRLVEVGQTSYRGDRYRFEATLRRRRQPWSGSQNDRSARPNGTPEA